MARLVERIESLADPTRGTTYSVGVIHGGTFANVVPLHCEAEALAVAPTAEALAEIRASMAALKPSDPGIGLAVEAGPERPLFEPNAGTLALYELARAIARDNGFDVEHGSVGGGSDGNFTGALGIATLDGLGPCGAGFHTHEEHIHYSSLEPRARLLAGLLLRLGEAP